MLAHRLRRWTNINPALGHPPPPIFGYAGGEHRLGIPVVHIIEKK